MHWNMLDAMRSATSAGGFAHSSSPFGHAFEDALDPVESEDPDRRASNDRHGLFGWLASSSVLRVNRDGGSANLTCFDDFQPVTCCDASLTCRLASDHKKGGRKLWNGATLRVGATAMSNHPQ
jgi:hypothetical protein